MFTIDRISDFLWTVFNLFVILVVPLPFISIIPVIHVILVSLAKMGPREDPIFPFGLRTRQWVLYSRLRPLLVVEFFPVGHISYVMVPLATP